MVRMTVRMAQMKKTASGSAINQVGNPDGGPFARVILRSMTSQLPLGKFACHYLLERGLPKDTTTLHPFVCVCCLFASLNLLSVSIFAFL